MSAKIIAAVLLVALFASVAHADAPAQIALSPQLQTCLQRADELPDIAAAEATAWIKKGGGDDAHLCRAFAQANRGMHVDAAREFWALASGYDKSEPHRAVAMHDLSGQEFLRAKDVKNATAQYDAALKIAPDDATSLTGRAMTLMESERYWDAINDLNRAIKAAPDDADALRQRGRAWAQLGNEKNAEEDFGHAAALAEK
ncbi:MAG: tetratricopeptide repeat protein [Alphaproteobacteria bacterium]|nr:tetratricopeptide repeat protein [Alphaproteobacteria bacterium]